MRHGHGAARSLVWLLIVVAAGAGCGAKPPYRVSEPPPPTAEQLERLGRIDLAPSPPGVGGEAPIPRVWIGIHEHRADGVVLGAAAGAVIGALAGAAIANPTGGAFDFTVEQDAAIGALVGAPVGGVIGALISKSAAQTNVAAAELRRHASAVDVSGRARDGASRSTRLHVHRDATPGAGSSPGGTLTIEVLAYGTRTAGGNRVCPFVAVRTRLVAISTGRVIYDSTSDLRGERRHLSQWWASGGADFRRELETLARELGTRSVDRALTPRAGRRTRN